MERELGLIILGKITKNKWLLFGTIKNENIEISYYHIIQILIKDVAKWILTVFISLIPKPDK